MYIISWNVNGLRACMNKGFLDFFSAMLPDFFCIQETKMQPGQAEVPLPEGYRIYWHSAEKKGYSGVAVITRHTPLSVAVGPGRFLEDHEGRLLTLEYPGFYLVNCYTPNAQMGLARIDYREIWEDAVRAYLCELDAEKPVIYCGDLNVAHQPIDLKNPAQNDGNACYSPQERAKLAQLLEAGFADTFRALYPDRAGAYTWWSYQFRARERDAGWRIDYALVSERLRPAILKADIYKDVFGSDHCPIGVELALPVEASAER
ncbi:MAG: exodeoxyribonuclease III [Oscillospiraceae bacterium]|nr:exodeoxyribonuclease III [Oscillospiraceae bacterium]